MAIVPLLAEVGGCGVNAHDNDLLPIDATSAEHRAILRRLKKAQADAGLAALMATTNLSADPAFRGGAFTAHGPRVGACALCRDLNPKLRPAFHAIAHTAGSNGR